MPKLFRVEWPGFAWMEAALFFPVAVMMAGELTTHRLSVSSEFINVTSSGGAGFGGFDQVLF
jgi:hypothetical protein